MSANDNQSTSNTSNGDSAPASSTGSQPSAGSANDTRGSSSVQQMRDLALIAHNNYTASRASGPSSTGPNTDPNARIDRADRVDSGFN